MNKSKRTYFGTDGIRGRVGQFPIIPEFMMKLGWALGAVFKENGQARVVIGKDTRISGYMLESALQSGLAAAGADSIFLGPMPTPGIAFLTQALQAQVGIVISASHNPYYDNGVKLFSAQGCKLSDEIEASIEQFCQQEMQMVAAEELGKASRCHEALQLYQQHCLQNVTHLNLKGLTCVIDCANGANYQIAPALFAATGLQVKAINTEPDGLNINRYCGSTHLNALTAAVRNEGADFGIAFDGDGDRVIFVDHCGTVVDGDQLLYVIAMHAVQARGYEGGIVGTLMSNFALEQACKQQSIPFARAKVGDKHVMAELRKRSWLYGGESSGHIIALDKSTTGDGIIAALLVLEAMQDSNRNLQELCQGMQKYPQHLLNVALPGHTDPSQHPKVQAAVKNAEKELKQQGRVLLRCSGTEPLVRIMVEGFEQAVVERLASDIALVVEEVVCEQEPV